MGLFLTADGDLAGLATDLARFDEGLLTEVELCVAVDLGLAVELADGFVEVALEDAEEVAHGDGRAG